MYRYSLYGYNIETNIAMPLNTEIKDNDTKSIEFIVKYNKTDIEIDDKLYLEKDVRIYNISFSGSFFIFLNEEKIVCYRNKDILDSVVFSCFVNFIMPYYLQINGCLCLHSSSIVNEQGDLTAIMGDSGSGKSTLVSKLMELNKYKYFSDDILVLLENKCFPSYPYIKNVYENYSWLKDVKSMGTKTEKKILCIKEEKIHNMEARITRVIYLKKEKVDKITKYELFGTDKIIHLIRQIFCINYLTPNEKKEAIEAVSCIVNIPLYIVLIPENNYYENLKEVAAEIEEMIYDVE